MTTSLSFEEEGGGGEGRVQIYRDFVSDYIYDKQIYLLRWQGRFLCSLFVAVKYCRITEPFLT